MVETGFTRAKNALHTMTMNFIVFVIGAIGFYFVGFALMFGGIGGLSTLGGNPVLNKELLINGWGIIGYKGFLLSGVSYDVAVFTLFCNYQEDALRPKSLIIAAGKQTGCPSFA